MDGNRHKALSAMMTSPAGVVQTFNRESVRSFCLRALWSRKCQKNNIVGKFCQIYVTVPLQFSQVFLLLCLLSNIYSNQVSTQKKLCLYVFKPHESPNLRGFRPWSNGYLPMTFIFKIL